jgi:hypothetical protein
MICRRISSLNEPRGGFIAAEKGKINSNYRKQTILWHSSKNFHVFEKFVEKQAKTNS